MKVFKKFFVILLAISSCLLTGCTLPPEKDPPPNYVVHMSNGTGYKLRFMENGYTKEGYIFPGQTKIFNITAPPWKHDIVYKIVAFRPGRSAEEIVATVVFPLTVQAEDGYSVKSRILEITYRGGTGLDVTEMY
jgi:hypothetical protein